MIIWIFFISAVCTLIYSIVAYDYLRYDAMWAECLFPGVVVWNKLDEMGYHQVNKIIISSVASIVLFTYTLVMILFLMYVLVVHALEGLTKCISKKR